MKKVNEDSYVSINFTITLAEEKTQKIFEPRASTTKERFEAIKKLREEGIHSGVYFYPILPFIGDTNENMKDIFNQAKLAGAEFVYCWGLTLKPGRSKDEYLHSIKENFPSLSPKYDKLYGNNNKYGHLDIDQFKKMGLVWPEVKGFKLGYEHELGYCAKRYIPEGRIKPNLQLSEILFKIAHVKNSFFHTSRSKIRKYTQTALFLETFQEDISQLEQEELEKLSIPENVLPIIWEFVKQGKSSYLNELENKAYKSITL